MTDKAEHKHCYHATGFAWSTTYDSSHSEICCHCGNQITVTLRAVPPAGHGPYAPHGAWERVDFPLPRAG